MLIDAELASPMPILLNDFRRQWDEISRDVLVATTRIGSSGWYILGAEVRDFEQALANWLGRKHVIGCANGLDAIEIGLRALGIKPGDKVLTTPLSAFATTLAIVRAGGIPVFVDVDGYGLMDLEATRCALQRDAAIRFMVPVHLYGHSLNLETLAEIKQTFDVKIVEDCCQAIGARFRGLQVGSIGEASALSFYPTKNLGALGDAGALFCDDAKTDCAARALRDYGQSTRYEHSVLGLNSRLDEFHAAILRTALLPRLERWTQRRQQIARQYLSGIRNPQVALVGAPSGSDSVWHLFPVLVDPSLRSAFRQALSDAGVNTAVHYPKLITAQDALATVHHELLGALEMAERFCNSEVSLPMHPQMTDNEIERVVAAINCWKVR
jgi:dTDP-3-amino-3,4,6-trideoxy-alpha-D-glucose transaminase